LVEEYGHDALTDPTETPDGKENPHYDAHPDPHLDTPELTQIWDTAPHIPGEDVDIEKGGGDGGGGDKGPPPVHQRFAVSPGSIRDAENELLSETKRQIVQYESLKGYVNSTKHWIFGFDNPDDMLPHAHPKHGEVTPVDKNYKVTHELHAVQDEALVAIAQVIVVAGQLVAMLNNGAQAYAQADLHSFMPEADNSSGDNPG
jgi:hypothetical protein